MMTMCKADPFVKNSGTEGNANAPLCPPRVCAYRRRLASRSDSSRQRMSFSRTAAQTRVSWGWPAGGAASRGKQRKGKRTRALDVADDGAGLVVHELDTALGDTTTGACRFRQPFCFPAWPSLASAASPPRPRVRDHRVPVRPRTRVTLTSLTGALADSILCGC
jgi:hypothetical protein